MVAVVSRGRMEWKKERRVFVVCGGGENAVDGDKIVAIADTADTRNEMRYDIGFIVLASRCLASQLVNFSLLTEVKNTSNEDTGKWDYNTRDQQTY